MQAPLTAQSTVVHAVSTGMGTSTSKPAPVSKAAQPGSSSCSLQKSSECRDHAAVAILLIRHVQEAGYTRDGQQAHWHKQQAKSHSRLSQGVL